ncbi:MAG: hypothetical protein HY437_01895 [Candidatus Magasanikbacteria bacterium]|nr:hypothetical protein [Candidatus Magasanikbacteria bacterium]
MGAKNLARTVIEGGRTDNSKYDRRRSHRLVRRKLTMALIAACREEIPCVWRGRPWLEEFEPECETENDAFVRQPVRREFDDRRLSPLWRWMDSRVGRLWDEVHAEVKARFNTRTTAGRHIVYCHLLDSVEYAHEPRAGYSRYQIDEDGVLRDHGPRVKGWWHRGTQSRVTKNETLVFANGRKVVQHGSELYWLVATENLRTCHEHACSGRTNMSHYHTAYRQDARLTEDERKFFSECDPEMQRKLMNVLVAF